MADRDWKLLYWTQFPGRGEFVRLMFEEAGVSYEDVGRRSEGGDAEVVSYLFSADRGHPVMAPPMIEDKKSGFILCQTPAILEFLGKEYGMWPEGGREAEAHASQLNAAVADYFTDCNYAFHPLDMRKSYDEQKEEADVRVAGFAERRVPKFMKYFGAVLNANNRGDGFMFGTKLSYVDLAVFHSLRATEFQFPEAYRAAETPKLKAFKERIAQRPKISAYLSSDRARPFGGHSFM